MVDDCALGFAPAACGPADGFGPVELAAGVWYVIVEQAGGEIGPFTLTMQVER